jgi:hypothetical protein
MHKVSLAILEALPTLAVGQADDLKIDDGETRIWLSRCGVEDGEPYANKFTVEKLINGRWVETKTYRAPIGGHYEIE